MAEKMVTIKGSRESSDHDNTPYFTDRYGFVA
jgi:hypothetical protein